MTNHCIILKFAALSSQQDSEMAAHKNPDENAQNKLLRHFSDSI